ncbi:MAG: beta-galactosidase, partial [Lentisphaeria bacterium]
MLSRLLPACLLTGLCGTVAAEMTVQSSYPAAAPHLTGTLVYPQDVLGMQRAAGWWFGGAVNGNSGGIRAVPAPGRPGRQALAFSFTANRADPRWLEWRYTLSPQLSVFGAREIVFDLYPVTDLTTDIYARFGTQQGQSVLPICWHSLGKHPAGKWVTVRIPIMTQRHIDNLKFDVDNQAEGVVQGQPVRFIIDNLRFEPAPHETAEVPIATLKTQAPVPAGYLELPLGATLKDAQPLQLHLELSVTASQAATLRVMRWLGPVELKPPCTVLDITIPNAGGRLGTGEFPLEVALTGTSGQRLAWLATPTPIATFSTTAMERQRQDLIRLRNQLQAKADRRPGNEEILVSLTVARLFLETYIPDDFNRQGAFAIAMRELADVRAILGQTEQALAQPPTHTAPLADYDPTRPVTVRDGNFSQDGHPVFFAGPLAWAGTPDAIDQAKSLGFNGVAIDLALPDWYGGKQEGATTAKALLERSRRAGIAMNFQLASHYLPKLSDADAPALGDGASGHPGLPWNLLRPETRRVLGGWYDAILPLFAAYPSLLNIGLANEPTYQVNPDSQSFQAGFRKWAAAQYRDIAAANARWDGHYPSFAAIDLPGFFALQKQNKGAVYDWNQFLAQTQGDFFAFLNNRVHRHLPHASVSAKLAGGYGYDYLDEQEILWRGGQTVHGTDGDTPMFLDYLKSLNPALPVFNGEWHLIATAASGNDPAYL